MNKAIIIGNLTRDPETRNTQSGIAMTTFTVACNRRFPNAQGVREADFFNILTWRQTADFCSRYLTKGSKVAVEGSIQIRSYDAQDGSRRTVVEIVADNVESLNTRSDRPQAGHYDEPTPPADTGSGNTGSGEFTEVEDDELPF